MMDTPQHSARDNADLLARSAFALLLVGFLITLAVGVALMRVSMRLTVRTPFLIGYGIFGCFVLGALVALLVLPLARIQAITRAVTRILGHPWLALVLTAIIVIGLAIAVPVIGGVFTNLTALTALLIGWSVILIVVLALSNADVLMRWYVGTRRWWAGLGIVLVAVMIIGLVYTAVDGMLTSSGLLDSLRGSVDFREVVFYGDQTDPALSKAYWTELGGLRATWVPYTYTRMQSFHGDLINIDDVGRRATTSFVNDTDAVPDVYFFGGSTMWGEGSRDDYTIASQLARLMNDDGTPIRATNYGQIAYVSTQELILFGRQLALGNIPDTVVFYDGFNDLAGVYIDNGTAGLPHNEINRQRDLLAGQVLRDGRPLLSEPNVDWADLNFSLVGTPNASPEQIADLYLQNLRLIRATAQAYGVKTLFVWQPAIMYKRNLDPREQLFVDQNRAAWPGFDELYQATDEELLRRVADEGLSDVLILSDLFADELRYLFFDRVHVIEDGNTLISQAIQPALMATIGGTAN